MSATSKEQVADILTKSLHPVSKLKMHTNETVEWYKARLVAKGFTQTEGFYYMDTLSHVVKMTIIRVLMTIAAVHN